MTWDGRYRIERTLGEGGMGKVVLAHDLLRDGRPLAIKILSPAYREAASLPLFVREFETQRALAHPNLPGAFEFGFAPSRTGPAPYFTMDFVQGLPLTSYRPTSNEVDALLVQGLRALDHMHHAGWLHRDLKPANILLGDELTLDTGVSLIDLGVASRIDALPEEILLGTPEYAAPELLSGRRLDERSDLYAFALVVYEAIEGHRPWRGSDVRELLQARLYSDLPPILNPHATPAVIELLHKLLRPRTDERPSTAAEVLDMYGWATSRTIPLEPVAAFRQRVDAQPMPSPIPPSRLFEGWGRRRDGTPGYAAIALTGTAACLDRKLVQQIAQRAAIDGARVIPVRVPAGAQEPLSALEPALAVLKELAGGADSTAIGGELLARCDAATVLVIENLQRADAASLLALQHGLAERRRQLRLLATCDSSEDAAAPIALQRFLDGHHTRGLQLMQLSPVQARSWIDGLLGPGVLGPDAVAMLQERVGGTAAGLRAGLVDLCARGVLVKHGDGYVVDRGRAAEPTDGHLDEAAMVGVEELLGCLDHALPESVVIRYLGDYAPMLPELFARGVLVRGDDGVMVGDEVARLGHRSATSAVKLRSHFGRLADAIAVVDGFGNQQALIGIARMQSARPVLAVPHLVRAANEVASPSHVDDALAYLARARDLLERHAGAESDRDAWRWRVMLQKVQVRVAMLGGDLAAAETACCALVELGADRVHVTTMRYGLDWRLNLDLERRDWDRLVQHARSRRALDGPLASADSVATVQWAEAERARVSAGVDDVLDFLDPAIDLADTLQPRVLLRVLRTQAEVLANAQRTDEAQDAAQIWMDEARITDQPAQKVRAGALLIDVYLQSAQPQRALALVRELSHTLPAGHTRHLDALLALALAQCHLALGWATTAREHANQAQVIAAREGDLILGAQARLAEAHALHYLGQVPPAIQRADDVLGVAEKQGVPWLVAEAALCQGDFGLRRDRSSVARRVEPVALGLASEAAERGEPTREGRALALAARAAMLQDRYEDAVAFARQAVERVDEHGSERYAPRAELILSRAYEGSGQAVKAAEILQSALSRVRAAADAISDGELRRSWLSLPDNAIVLGRARFRSRRS